MCHKRKSIVYLPELVEHSSLVADVVDTSELVESLVRIDLLAFVVVQTVAVACSASEVEIVVAWDYIEAAYSASEEDIVAAYSAFDIVAACRAFEIVVDLDQAFEIADLDRGKEAFDPLDIVVAYYKVDLDLDTVKLRSEQFFKNKNVLTKNYFCFKNALKSSI